MVLQVSCVFLLFVGELEHLGKEKNIHIFKIILI